VGCAVGHGNLLFLVTASRSQPWSTRSHIQRDLTSVHSNVGFHVAPVLGVLLFPISGNCTILVSAFFFSLILGLSTNWHAMLSHCPPIHPYSCPVSSCAPSSPVFKPPWDFLDFLMNRTSSLTFSWMFSVPCVDG